MSDLGLVSPELLLAKLAVDIDASRIVIEGKELRLAEVGEEEQRLAADDKRVRAEAAALAEQLAKLDDDSLSARKLKLRKHEFEHVTVKNAYRLLELAEERKAIASDIAASEAHIAKLEAEASQQNARKKEHRDG